MEKDSQSLSCSKSTSQYQSQEETLISSIEQYKVQLDEVSTALESASEENRKQLEELQLNLISILELTLNQLDHCQTKAKAPVRAIAQSNDREEHSSNNIDEEFKRFQSEIASLEDDNDKGKNSNEMDEDEKEFCAKMKELESSLKQLEGQNVRASYKERWGGFSYHNAIVLSLVPHDDSAVDYDNPEVLVLFSQPTCLAMVPCRFFLEGRCKFEGGGCKFSHGHRVAVKDLMEYRDPDRDELVSGSRVLALHDGHDFWHRGAVEDVLEGRKGFSFNCSHCVQVVEVDLEAMVPLFADEEAEVQPDGRRKERMSILQSSSSDDEREDAICVPTDAWLNTSLSTRLGDWEKHTKGIGSKLMAKMGYVIGTGLGPKGEGRVDPVTAYVYPQGVSLDHCMRLKEASHGGCILEVEKRLLNQQKKVEEKRKRQESHFKASHAGSVFDIINSKLNNDKSAPSNAGVKSTSQQSSGDEHALNVSLPALKKDSAKELRRKNLTLGSRIEKLKSEVANLRKSRARHAKDAATLKLIDSKVETRLQELSALQTAERQVELEQQSRKNVQKLCSF